MPILICENLGKEYSVGQARSSYERLSERLYELARRALRPRITSEANRDSAERFWALRHIDVQLAAGDILGIVGPNGAGKSTLLKILSRITPPSEGRVRLRARVASLLEVGTGFHQELTGRENIFLNGTILGMTRYEIKRKLDEIVEFAGVGRFLDTPVKRYSSGMQMRLAFSVAAHLEPEILLVDEVLAVGDAAFQRKSLSKIETIGRGGRTVVFVSHNIAAMHRLCSRGLWIQGGRMEALGAFGEVANAYLGSRSAAKRTFDPEGRSGRGWARFVDMAVYSLDSSGMKTPTHADYDLVIEATLEISDPHTGQTLAGLVVEFNIVNDDGQPVLSIMNMDGTPVGLPDRERVVIRARVPGPTVVPGSYSIRAFLGIPYLQHVDEIESAIRFDVNEPASPWRPYPLLKKRGLKCQLADWSVD